QMEDLSSVTIRNYLSDLRQFRAWCEGRWCEEQDKQSFTLQAVAPPLLICYRTHLQTIIWLKPSSINRALMSLKRYFAWATKMQLIKYDPTSIVKLVLKEAPTPRHLLDEKDPRDAQRVGNKQAMC